MFRAIALSLVSAFGLLAVIGPEGDLKAAGATPVGHTLAGNGFQPGGRYVVQAPTGLLSAPGPGAMATSRLIRGTPVLVLGTASEGLVRIRDHVGQTGYVPATRLAAAP